MTRRGDGAAPLDALGGASADLRRAAALLWPLEDPDVVVGIGTAPADHDVVESYLAIPTLRRARYLVPRTPIRVAAAAMLTYRALRSPGARAARVLLGTGLRAGAGLLARSNVIIVSMPRGIPAARRADALLVGHLGSRLGLPVLAGTSVRPDHPNLKPTLQLLDRRGRPVAFAKVGAGAATDRLVRVEADALGRMPDSMRVALGAPRLMGAGEWRGRPYVLATPLPPAVRRHGGGDAAPVAALGDALRTTVGTPQRLMSATYWARTKARIDAVCADAAERDLGAALTCHHRAVEARFGDQLVSFGWWHGDWVPWNIGWNGPQLCAWDWEYAAEDVPHGLDLAHWHFHVAYVLEREQPDAAMTYVDARLAGSVAALGGRTRGADCLAELYLEEVALRYYDLAVAGGGWTERFRPGVIRALLGRAARL